MLDEVKLEKDFVEFLNGRKGVEELPKLLVEYLSGKADVTEEEIAKELDSISEEIEQALEGETRGQVLYSSLKALKDEPTLEDFVKLYYITLAFQMLGENSVIEALKGEKAEEILKKAGRDDLLKEKLTISIRLMEDGGARLELIIPRNTLKTVADELYSKSREDRFAGALVEAIAPLLLFTGVKKE